MKVYDLNKKQKEAFNELKRAVAKCKKAKIMFVNNYGTIHAYDSALVNRFDVDTPEADINCEEYGYSNNYLPHDSLGGDSYADDQGLHYIFLTEKGREIFKEDQENM